MYAVVTNDPFTKLSHRQRQCLDLVYRRRTSKEIALQLGIDRSTVDNYIADAVRLIGATNRRTAAERFVEACGEYPSIIEDQSTRVDPAPAPLPMEETPAAAPLPLRLPLRRKGAARNDLGLIERLVWIPAIAIGVAVGFGMLAVGLRTVADILLAIARARH